MTPKVSLIIPVYNVEKYLRDCLDSIVKQNFTDFEAILIDDGATDTSGAICDEYAKKDDRFIVCHKENGGVSTARNKGLELSRASYVAFIDSDDSLRPDYVKNLYNAITDGDYDLVVCGYWLDRGKLSKQVKFENAVCVEDVRKGNATVTKLFTMQLLGSPVNKIYKKEKISLLFDPALTSIAEDLMFNLNFLSGIKKFKVIPDVLYNYMVRQASASTKFFTNRMESVVKTNNILVDFYRQTFDNSDAIKEIEKRCVAEIDSLYRHLFRGNENKKERLEILRAWSQGENYKNFINKCSIKKSIFFKSPEKIYRHYNFTTLLERTLIKLLTK